MTRLTFLGATGTVTGSKHLLETDGKKFLIDCGMFQGLKELRLRNWAEFPVDPASIDAIILTHAHIDHSGYLPKLVQMGFKGTIYATPSTTDLCRIMLPDSAHLQEEDAKYANKKQFTKHKPALPLYFLSDAENALDLFESLPYGKKIDLSPNVTLCYRDAGHILGSAFVDIRIKNGDEEKRVLFSGDLGRPNQPILRDPHTVFGTDYLILESTYGDRLHGERDRKEDLARVINDSYERGGVLIIPSFAVGRTQEILYTIRELEEEKRIPVMPVFVDSPMAINATTVFQKNAQDHDLESKVAEIKGIDILKTTDLRFARTAEQSKAINSIASRAIIISASGMVTGGRILHHLFNRLANPKNTVLFIGYQAEGTRGRSILEGAETIKIHGQHIPVKAKIEQISGFSAHADYNEILAWLSNFNEAPKNIFIVHGEASQSAALSKRIQSRFNWNTMIPKYLESVTLD
ncbi:MAG: MBL fold metallo-hydrolase [Candidatus Marinimicrobia bacterium]|nr:MBL fold metallo-hydrolase [Candidatus Neomarinimicrobiota bacterium]RKY60958.1 MAG: MBL fold metallo-hydrolase [Candidatus Neomarinimicrobiota bacterium]